MAKKVLLLVLCLPIIIMICLFTTTDAVSLAIDIPVTGIAIFGGIIAIVLTQLRGRNTLAMATELGVDEDDDF